MKEVIPNGTEVLIFHYIREWGTDQDESNYVKGVIQSSKESYDLSYHGTTYNEQIYEVLGNDGKTYYGAYGRGIIGDSFFRTVDDHIKCIKNSIRINDEKITKINNKNELLYAELSSLTSTKCDLDCKCLSLKKTTKNKQ